MHGSFVFSIKIKTTCDDYTSGFLFFKSIFFINATNETKAQTPSKIVNGSDSIITEEMQAKVAPIKLIKI